MPMVSQTSIKPRPYGGPWKTLRIRKCPYSFRIRLETETSSSLAMSYQYVEEAEALAKRCAESRKMERNPGLKKGR